MRSFSVKNVKSFLDDTEIDIKPITVLVGKNSCGKSTLARFPAVLSQTFCGDSNSPIQLFGDMIDYGTFDDVVFNHDSDEFSFSMKYRFNIVPHKYGYLQNKLPTTDKVDCRNVELKTTVRKNDKGLEVSKQSLFFGDKCVYEYRLQEGKAEFCIFAIYDYLSLSFSEEEYLCKLDGKNIYRKNTFVFPNDKYLKEGLFNSLFSECEFPFDNITRQITIEDLLYSEGYVKSFKVQSWWVEKIRQAIRDDESDSPYVNPYLKGFFHGQKKAGVKWQENDKPYTFEEVKYWRVYNAFRYYTDILTRMYNICKKEFEILSYIGPFRQNPERIYREIETQTHTVGAKGENSISVLIKDQHNKSTLIRSVSEWLNKVMGYSIAIDNVSNGYYQLILEDNTGIKSNVSDVGFGVSQILPILIQVFNKSRVMPKQIPDNPINAITIIEQPELHLHPAAQAELASLFTMCVASEPSLRLVIETHSEHLIRKLQVLIADPNTPITSDDVAVYYVDKDADGKAGVNELEIMPNGQFKQIWPSGFFDKAFELSMELLSASSGE